MNYRQISEITGFNVNLISDIINGKTKSGKVDNNGVAEISTGNFTIKIDFNDSGGKRHNIYLGSYSSYQDAANIKAQAEIMKSNGINDLEKYYELKSKYKQLANNKEIAYFLLQKNNYLYEGMSLGSFAKLFNIYPSHLSNVNSGKGNHKSYKGFTKPTNMNLPRKYYWYGEEISESKWNHKISEMN